MATFFIEQFGCRATQADAAAIERQLLERGYAASPDARSADVVVVNTCTVTAAADLQARQSIRTIHRENPAARVVVTGCYAQRAPDELAVLEGVSWVVGNSHKPEIPRLIQEMTPETGGDERNREMAGSASWPTPSAQSPAADETFVPLAMIAGMAASHAAGPANILTGDILQLRELLVAPVQGGEAGHTRPVLKIQDGCNRSCSYCVIPHVRGRRTGSCPQRNRLGKLRPRSCAARRAGRFAATHSGRNSRRTPTGEFHRADGCDRGSDRDFRGQRPNGQAFPHAATIRLGPHPGRHAPVVSRRALCAPRGTRA